MTTESPTTPPKLGQIVLRIDDEHGHHIIRTATTIYGYTIEGYSERPENYQHPPQYFFPFTKNEVKAEFAKQGKEWRYD